MSVNEMVDRIDKIRRFIRSIDRDLTVIENEIKQTGIDKELMGKLDEVIRKWIEFKALFMYIRRRLKLQLSL